MTREDRIGGLKVVGAMAALMWVVEVVDAIDSHRLDRWGIQPREGDGLIGVVTAPFLHVGFGHLMGNTIPFLIMGAAIALGGALRVLAVTAIVALISGLGTWIIAPAGTVHLGASGVVFGYAAYLIFRGLFDRSLLSLGVGAIVAAAFGAVLLGGLVPHTGVSWQAHFFGAVGGLVAARVLSARAGQEQLGEGPARGRLAV